MLGWFVTLAFLSMKAALAADITLSPPATLEDLSARQVGEPGSYYPGFAIEGIIEPGDFEKFEQLVIQQGMEFNTVWIASPGGDVLEAMKIGRLIRELRYSVYLPIGFKSINRTFLLFGMKDTKNNVCASACFYIYVAGVQRIGTIVGIHRPYLSRDAYRKMDLEDAIAANDYVRSIVAEYFDEMGVPDEYVNRSFQIPSGETEWLSESEVNSRFNHYIPEVDEWLAAQCDTLTPTEQGLYDRFESTPVGDIHQDIRPFVKEVYEKVRTIDACKGEIQSYAACQAHHSRYSEQNGMYFCDEIRRMRQSVDRQ